MVTLRIEHKIASYEGWRKAFDSDPIDRKKSGVKQYRIYQPADDEKYIIIDLDFENIENAVAALEALKILWGRVEGTLMFNPQTRILNVIEKAEY